MNPPKTHPEASEQKAKDGDERLSLSSGRNFQLEDGETNSRQS